MKSEHSVKLRNSGTEKTPGSAGNGEDGCNGRSRARFFMIKLFRINETSIKSGKGLIGMRRLRFFIWPQEKSTERQSPEGLEEYLRNAGAGDEEQKREKMGSGVSGCFDDRPVYGSLHGDLD